MTDHSALIARALFEDSRYGGKGMTWEDHVRLDDMVAREWLRRGAVVAAALAEVPEDWRHDVLRDEVAAAVARLFTPAPHQETPKETQQ